MEMGREDALKSSLRPRNAEPAQPLISSEYQEGKLANLVKLNLI
jgi:hypothetical protein